MGDQVQRGAGPVVGWPTLSSAPQSAAAPLAPVAEAQEAGAGAGEAASGGAPAAAEERGRGRGAAKALLERLSAEPGSAGGGGGLPPLPESAPAVHAVDAPVPGGGVAGEAAPRTGKRVSFAGAQSACAEPAGSGGSEAEGGGEASTAAPMALDLGPAMQQRQQEQQQGPTLASISAAAAAAGGGAGGDAGPAGAVVDPKDLEQLMRRMHFRSNKGLGPGEHRGCGSPARAAAESCACRCQGMSLAAGAGVQPRLAVVQTMRSWVSRGSARAVVKRTSVRQCCAPAPLPSCACSRMLQGTGASPHTPGFPTCRSKGLGTDRSGCTQSPFLLTPTRLLTSFLSLLQRR